MVQLMDMTPEEVEALDSFLEALSQKVGFKISLNYLLSRWKNFVNELQAGYNNSIYEYQNDLSIRKILQDLINSVPEPLQEKLKVTIEPLEQKFQEVTIEPNQKTLEDFPFLRGARIPKKIIGELQDDLG